jgi:hypothetical protein
MATTGLCLIDPFILASSKVGTDEIPVILTTPLEASALQVDGTEVTG